MCVRDTPSEIGNAQSVQRISQLRGRGGLEPGPGGIGFGAPNHPGGLEGANVGSLRSGRRAQVLLTLIAGTALFIISRGERVVEYSEEGNAKRLRAPPDTGRLA